MVNLSIACPRRWAPDIMANSWHQHNLVGQEWQPGLILIEHVYPLKLERNLPPTNVLSDIIQPPD